MKRDIEKIKSAAFDLVIIGGGITGACLAHDAALRGLRVALVEKNDFGMSTSSASSKLLHGGIRYLQKLQFGKVRESARERTYFQIIAPHITTTIPFLIPTIQGSIMKGRAALLAGMNLYRTICSGLNGLVSDPSKKVEFGAFFSKSKVLEQVPMLKAIGGLSGAHTLFESHMHNSERMTLAFIKSAVHNGSQAANHVAVQRLISTDERITGVHCRDTLSGEEFQIEAKMVVNAAGPFLPGINSQIESLRLFKNTTGFSKGVHIVVRQLEEKYALALSSGKKTEGLVTRGGRHIFMIPWRGRTLIGTTNVPFADKLDKVRVTVKDIDDFLQDINAIVPGLSLENGDVHYAFAGLYPLISDEIKTDTYQGTGEYQVVDHSEQGGPEGIVSVMGAKYTTARAIAEQAVDLIGRKMSMPDPRCRTASVPLFEGRIDNLEQFIAKKQQHYREILPAQTVHDLIVSHGSEVDKVIDYCRNQAGYLEKLSEERETLVGEVAYAVEHEMACTLDDVVFARTGLGTIGHPGTEVLNRVVKVIGPLLAWDEPRCRDEIEAVERRYQWN
ncbi:FAD-dependent oxidoreductase [Thermodesulfobacteriota bacterium]